jgi:hypothetical protein
MCNTKKVAPPVLGGAVFSRVEITPPMILVSVFWPKFATFLAVDYVCCEFLRITDIVSPTDPDPKVTCRST